MATGSGLCLVFKSTALPLLPGARKLALRGFLTGGCTRNRAYLADKVTIRSSVKASYGEVAFDPQTSGGLLIAVPGREADRLVRALRARGIAAVSIVGTAVPREDAWVILR